MCRRTVFIDSNLPVQLAESLRKKSLLVRHVNEINPRMSDTHFQITMLSTDVLLTRDGNQYCKLRDRAIFLGLGAKTRLNFCFVSRPRETLVDEWARGITEFRIKRGRRIYFPNLTSSSSISYLFRLKAKRILCARDVVNLNPLLLSKPHL